MYAGKEFSPADVGEDAVFSIDFVKNLAVGETIVSSHWECTVAVDSVGSDPSPQDHLIGDAEISGTISMQEISGLLPGVKYVLQAWVATDQDPAKSLWSHVPCETPG